MKGEIMEILYEKKYSRIDPAGENGPGNGEKEQPTADLGACEEPFPDAPRDTVCIPLPDRLRASKTFIRTAVEVSELYELDTRIERHNSHLSVSYSFDCCGALRDIRRIFAMADEFAFFRGICGRDITVSMDYYTHAVVYRGRILAPDPERFAGESTPL